MSLHYNSGHSFSDSLQARNGNNDLTLSVRNSRKKKIGCCSDLFNMNSYEQMNLNDSRNKQFSFSDVLVASGDTGSTVDGVQLEARTLNHSDMFLHEDPRMYLLSDVQISNRIETVVDELYETMISGVAQGAVSTMKAPIVNSDLQNLPGTSVELCDLKPSNRCEKPERFGKNQTKPCSRKEASKDVQLKIMNHERSKAVAESGFEVYAGERMDEILPQMSGDPYSTVDTVTLVQTRRKRVSLPLEHSFTSNVDNGNSLLCEESTVSRTDSLNICASMENVKKLRENGRMSSSSDNELLSESLFEKHNERTRSSSKKRKNSFFSDDNKCKKFKKKTKSSVDVESRDLNLNKKCSESNMHRHCVNGKLSFKKTLHSKRKKSDRKENASKMKLNTPSKSLLLIQNVHKKIARSGEFQLSDLGNEENDEEMLSKLHDIVPLQSVIHRPVRSLRSSTVSDKHSLHRKICTDGIWNSVNSTY